MVGITLLLDLWRKNQSFNMTHSYPSSSLFSTSATAASISVGASFASNAFFGTPVAYSDSGVTVPGDYLSGIRTSPGKYFYHDSLKYTTKSYNVELKPLWSAFELRSFALISLRSFLMFYLPLLEPHAKMAQDYDEFMHDIDHDEVRTNLSVPFKKSLLQIVREVTVATTRCILERITFHYVSRRMAWKLLKDVPTSAVRKAGRNMPTSAYFLSVTKATFRGHMLGVTASWIVQVGVRIYQFFTSVSRYEDGSINKAERNRIFREKVFIATLRCNASLVFASIGGGIGATLFRPSIGQWIGCAVGDLTGPVIVAVCANRVFHTNL